MKMLLLAVACAFGGVGCVQQEIAQNHSAHPSGRRGIAATPDAASPRKPQEAGSESTTMTVTGTNIARPVRRIGNTYDTVHAIYVIDNHRIEQEGSRDLADALRRNPSLGIH